MAARIPTLLLLLMACLSYPCTSSFMAPIPPRARTNAYSGWAVSTTAMASAKASVEEDFVADFSSLPSMESLSPVQTLDSSRAMLSAIETARENQLVVVFFHAHYCKLCQRSNIQYRKVAHRHHEIRFTRLETSHLTSPQLRDLGVSKLPWVQIYRNAICVASFGTQKELERCLTDTIISCQERTIPQWMQFMSDFEKEISENKRARTLLSIEPTLQGPLKTVTQPLQLLRVIDEAPTDTLTVILYHSHFVEACRHAQHQLRSVIDYYGGRVEFARVEETVLRNDDLMALGVDRYPYIQIYRNGELVSAFATGPSYMFKKAVFDSIDGLLNRSEAEWLETLDQLRSVTTENRSALDRMANSYKVSP